MSSPGLDIHCEMILDEYRLHRPVFEKMRQVVDEQLNKCLEDNDIKVNAIESRIKEEASLIGKLELKGYKYQTLSDITDILGARVITFYTDEVDKISALVDKVFDVDWSNSVDKRKLLDLDRFGYMSLHYICRIPESLFSDPQMPEVNDYRFEIQMRTALQHVWATMYHDTGYKSGIEVPKEYLRNMNRIAGMLELADEQFSRIRMEITDYRRNVQSLVASGSFDDVPLNGDTFRSYLKMDPFRNLIMQMASINQAEVCDDNMLPYLNILLKMGFKTLGDIEQMRLDCSDAAYQLALHQFAGTDLDIMACSLSLQNLCIAYILRKGYGEAGLQMLFQLQGGSQQMAEDRARRTMQLVKKINLV